MNFAFWTIRIGPASPGRAAGARSGRDGCGAPVSPPARGPARAGSAPGGRGIAGIARRLADLSAPRSGPARAAAPAAPTGCETPGPHGRGAGPPTIRAIRRKRNASETDPRTRHRLTPPAGNNPRRRRCGHVVAGLHGKVPLLGRGAAEAGRDVGRAGETRRDRRYTRGVHIVLVLSSVLPLTTPAGTPMSQRTKTTTPRPLPPRK